jgi:hypothetical protein
MRARLTLLVVYAAAWALAAWWGGQRGELGFDFTRRGASIYSAVSMVDIVAVLLLAPIVTLEACSWSSLRGRLRLGSTLADIWARVRSGAAQVAGLIALSTACAAVLTAASAQVEVDAFVGTRVLLVMTALAAMALALLASAICRDVHDAAAITYAALAALATSSVLAAPLLALRSEMGATIAGLLLTNPVVGMASAVNFDLFRTELLYRLTPVGQRAFEYPAWQAVSAVQAGFAAACVLATYLVRTKETPCA